MKYMEWLLKMKVRDHNIPELVQLRNSRESKAIVPGEGKNRVQTFPQESSDH